jgi:hypothetical protein
MCRQGCSRPNTYVYEACTPWSNARCRGCSSTACPAGWFLVRPCGTDHDVECAPCLPGYYAPLEGSNACTACAPGSVAAENGTVACAACARYADPPQTECVDTCPAGAAPSGPRSCAWCPAGSESPDGALCVVRPPTCSV